jgi:hypothetical protein
MEFRPFEGMRRVLLGCALILAVTVAWPSRTQGACAEDCDDQYRADVDDCHRRLANDPSDADDLLKCIETASDNYRSCAEDCANPTLTMSFSAPSR